MKHEGLGLDTQRDFQRDISRHLLWSWWILFFWLLVSFCQETELLPIHLRGPKSGLLTNRGWTLWSLEDYLFSGVVSVLQKEGEDAHVRPLGKGPKSRSLHLKHVIWVVSCKGVSSAPISPQSPPEVPRFPERLGMVLAMWLACWEGILESGAHQRHFSVPPWSRKERVFFVFFFPASGWVTSWILGLFCDSSVWEGGGTDLKTGS